MFVEIMEEVLGLVRKVVAKYDNVCLGVQQELWSSESAHLPLFSSRGPGTVIRSFRRKQGYAGVQKSRSALKSRM